MIVFKKAAFGAAFSLMTLAAIAGVPGGSSLTASDIPDRADSALLPQSVIDAAIAEESAIPDQITLPPVVEDRSPAKAASLSELVARHSATATDDREMDCLAGGVYFESKGEPLIGQLAVAEVILNRAKSGRFASTTCGVILQPGQFSFVRGGGFPPIARNSRDWRTAVAIARIAQEKSWSSGVGKALFFHATHVSPRWRLTRVAALGNHIFYR